MRWSFMASLRTSRSSKQRKEYERESFKASLTMQERARENIETRLTRVEIALKNETRQG